MCYPGSKDQKLITTMDFAKPYHPPILSHVLAPSHWISDLQAVIFVTGVAFQCILQADCTRVTERALPCQRSEHLLLPWRWLHLCGWAGGGQQWDTSGQAHQEAKAAKEWPWRLLALERFQPWHWCGLLWQSVPHLQLWWVDLSEFSLSDNYNNNIMVLNYCSPSASASFSFWLEKEEHMHSW